MDPLSWLRLQLEWGVDEALANEPVDRRSPRAALPDMAERALLRPPAPAALPPIGAVPRAQALAAGARTVTELREALAGFDGCGLRATATNLVFSDGDPAASVMLIADVPGPAEDRAGLPFAGAAAAFLDRMLASAGLDRAAMLATSLLPWRPPGDRKPAETEVQLCLPFLLRHIELAAPARILLFGNLAARTLLPADTRRSRVGWQEIAGVDGAAKVACLAFPSVLHIQATLAAKRDAWANLLRLRRAMDAGFA